MVYSAISIIFVPMNTQQIENIHWSENVIIADAEYIDRVAFDLIVNFERMLDRRIPPADLSRWTMDIALDGGLREGKHETQLVLLHDAKNTKLENFAPTDYKNELNGKAFNDERLGEFIVNTIATDGKMSNKEEVMLDILQLILGHKEVQRIMVVPDADASDVWQTLRNTLDRGSEFIHETTLFAMQPMPGGRFAQQILGYSLMNAMGITQREIDEKMK